MIRVTITTSNQLMHTNASEAVRGDMTLGLECVLEMSHILIWYCISRPKPACYPESLMFIDTGTMGEKCGSLRER
jgi:hypothetical protein